MLEVIAQSLEDAKAIEAAGCHRIELVSAMAEGGLTPSFGLIEAVVKHVSIPVNVMIRPHSYGFDYTDDTIAVMKRDIEIVESLGANGIVVGCLKEGKVISTLLNSSCNITFHRAIDESIDVVESYRQLCEMPVDQVLSSGGPGKAINNLNILDQMYEISSNKLLIGSGVTSKNIVQLVNRYPSANFHVGSDARIDKCFSKPIDVKSLDALSKLVK